MEIKLNIGIGDLKFGFNRVQIEEIIGSPDLERVDEDNDNQVILAYNSLNLRLTLYRSEKMRMGYIECSHPLLTFQSKKLIGEDINYIKEQVFRIASNDWEIENYHSFDSHFYESTWLILYSEFEKVNRIELGVPLKNGEDYNWPK